MKHSIKLFLTISLCITTNISITMEVKIPEKKNPKIAKILSEITCIQNPESACYLTENTILVRAKDVCGVVDLTTNKEIKRIFNNDSWSFRTAVHPHKTKFALAAHHYPENKTDLFDAIQKITIHNATTYAIEHTIEWDKYGPVESMYFSPLDDTIAIFEIDGVDLILYNYITGKTRTIKVPEAQREHMKGYDHHSPRFSFHPTQSEICLAWQTLYTHDLTTSTRKKIISDRDYYNFCEYSPDGSYIAVGTSYKANIIQLTPKNPSQEQSSIQNQKISTLYSKRLVNSIPVYIMTIHPNGQILMVLSKTDDSISMNSYSLEYWDINTLECITTNYLPSYTPHFSFSPSGTKFLAVHDNKCVEYNISFKAFYKDIAKKTLLYLLFALKHYAHEGAALPHELTQLIATTIHEKYKR